MSFLKKVKAWSFIEVLFNLILGILFIVSPNFTKLTIIYLFASMLMLVGIIKCCNYFTYGIEPFGFINGLINIALSVLFFANANVILNANIFGFLFGVIFVCKGLFSIEWSFNCRRLGAKYWWIDTLTSLVVFGLGITLICLPQTENIIFIVLGVTLICQAISTLIDTIVVSSKIKKARKTLKDIFAKNEPIILSEDEYTKED